MTGRPSTFTQEIADSICEQIADGKSLRSICAAEEMPAKSSVFKWLSQHKDFADQYTRARESQADALFDDLADVAEEALKAETAVEVSARKLIVDTHKWRLSKIAPKKYGEKLELAGDPKAPLGIAVIERRVIDPSNRDS